jgi:hypothetical protein
MKFLFACALVLSACDVDAHRAGYRGECGNAGGTLLGCDDAPIETPEDACWRLVECGAIPVQNPEDQPRCCFDWARCVEELSELPEWRQAFTLACIEASTCDQLKWSNPDRPTNNDLELPSCLQYGDQ